MKRFLISFVLLAALAALAFSQAGSAPPKKGTVEQIMVHGKSLEGNLNGDSPDRAVFVYLPPSYATEKNRRYPVVYLLHGYGLTGERWISFIGLPELADKTVAAGTAKEMILVSPDAFNKYNGSMYSSSPATGDWETFIAEDLVNYMDTHYRTVANRMSRGLAGHSMGGYGTVRIGMKRPDVFSSMYIMSACCLMNNPGAGRGGQGAVKQGAPKQPAPDAAKEGKNKGKGGGFGNVQAAEASAWSPNPNNPPDFYDLPTRDGEVVPSIAAKWIANSPLAMVDQYVTNLKKYHAIAGDCGLQDGLIGSNKDLDASFTRLGIKHSFDTYEGDHTNHVKDRFEGNVLPFFASNLTFPQHKK
ncbi:MAG: esterase [Bryobacterales bacterium]|nr:esterase [Bryobacterales bacterium]MBV9399146.1 esterase [Bryobacterales bacterium]